MAAIKSIQRGTVTVGAPTTASITAVDLSKSLLVFGMRKDGTERPREDFFRGRFTSTTELTFARVEDQGSDGIIDWWVIEWDSGVVRRLPTDST